MTTMQEKVSKEVLEGSWIEDKKSLTKFGDRSPYPLIHGIGHGFVADFESRWLFESRVLKHQFEPQSLPTPQCKLGLSYT